MDAGGGNLDWEDEYGVIESYRHDVVTEDAGFVYCDQRFYWAIVGVDLDSSSQAVSGSDGLPPHGFVDNMSEEEVDRKRLKPQERKSRKASFAIARALEPARAVEAIAKLTKEIDELDNDSDGAPIMCPFDEVVKEVDGQ